MRANGASKQRGGGGRPGPGARLRVAAHPQPSGRASMHECVQERSLPVHCGNSTVAPCPTVRHRRHGKPCRQAHDAPRRCGSCTADRDAGGPAGGDCVQYDLYGRNLPDMLMLTRSPAAFGSRFMSMRKSIALMMPSPNSSWMSSLKVVP